MSARVAKLGREVGAARADVISVRLVEGLRQRVQDAGRDARRKSSDRERQRTGEPFTDKEVHQLAFGLPEQWVGIIHRERWRAHGGPVMDAWDARVRAEAEQAAESEPGEAPEAAPPRPEPWPVPFYGRPERTGG